MLILSEKDVRHCLNMEDCLAVNAKALTAIATGEAVVPTRIGLQYHHPPIPTHHHHHGEQEGGDDHHHSHHHHHHGISPSSAASAAEAQDWTLFKPAAYYRHSHMSESFSATDADVAAKENDDDHHHDHDSSCLMGIKVVSIRSQNPAQYNLPLVPATILSMNAATGMVEAVLASTYLTAARTAAGSALSCALARPEAQHLTVFGAGLQAELHIAAIATALNRPIPKVTLVNRTEKRALELKQRLLLHDHHDHDEHDHHHVHYCNAVEIVLLDDKMAVAEALSTSDVIVTATNSVTPLFDGTFLPSGCHIAGVGSYTPDMQEVSARTVDRCKVMIDTQEARLVGDLKCTNHAHPVKLLGEVLHDASWLRQPDPVFDCTFYKSVGTAIQDVMTADMVVKRARELGIGQEVDMS